MKLLNVQRKGPAEILFTVIICWALAAVVGTTIYHSIGMSNIKMALQTSDSSIGGMGMLEQINEEFVPQQQHSPTILNSSKHTMVVFQERGTFYNCQVLHPGEAVSMTKKQTGGMPLLPYKVHVLVGDENCLPSPKDSQKNLLKVTAIPAAFVAGCFATAISAGMLVGPSVALAPLVSGMVVNGVVIDSAALAAGGIMATRAQAVTDMLLKTQPDKFMFKTGSLRPGQRYLVISGGLADGSVKVEEVKKKKFEKQYGSSIKLWKKPLSNKGKALGGENSPAIEKGESSEMLESREDAELTMDEGKAEEAQW